MRRRMAPATVLSLAASTAVLCSRTRAQASLSFWVGCCGWAMEKEEEGGEEEEGRTPRVSVVISSGQGETGARQTRCGRREGRERTRLSRRGRRSHGAGSTQAQLRHDGAAGAERGRARVSEAGLQDVA